MKYHFQVYGLSDKALPESGKEKMKSGVRENEKWDLSTFSPGIIPPAASKQAPEIRPCSRSSGLGASPSLPSGSDPITLKYLKI